MPRRGANAISRLEVRATWRIFLIPSRSGRILALLAALGAFTVYWVTLAHTITWQHGGADSGDLVTAAYVLGIPHPPGYPLYTLLAFFFAHNPILEPAHGVAIFSALTASASVFLLARAGTALRSSLDLGKGVKGELIAPLAALAFAFAPMLWSQATIAQVYTLNLFFVAVILWSCITANPRRVYIAALGFGFGVTHYLAILLLAPAALVALAPSKKNWRAILVFAVPLIVYLYLPITALRNPPINWGAPATVDRFVWLISAQAYQPNFFRLDGTEIYSRFAFAARAFVEQFTLVGAALIVWGAVRMGLTRTRLFFSLLLMFVPPFGYAILYAQRDVVLYLLPAFGVTLLWMVYGVADILKWLKDDRLLRGAAIALFALLPVYNLVTHFSAMDVSRDRTAFEYAEKNFQGLPVDAVLFADGDEALFALWYYRHAIAFQNARSVIVSQGLVRYDWYYDSLRRIMSEVKFQEPNAVLDAHQRAREIIRVTFAEGRAVCFTDSSPLLPDFEYEERGAVKCVIAEKASAAEK